MRGARGWPLLNKHVQLPPHHVDEQLDATGFHQVAEQPRRDLESDGSTKRNAVLMHAPQRYGSSLTIRRLERSRDTPATLGRRWSPPRPAARAVQGFRSADPPSSWYTIGIKSSAVHEAS